MYGDTGVMRKRAAQLREQGATSARRPTSSSPRSTPSRWTGRAADAMRERIRDRAAHLREVAAAHDSAADSLERPPQQVECSRTRSPRTERKTDKLATDARARVAQARAADDPDGVHRAPDPEDRVLAGFTPPPSGSQGLAHRRAPGTLMATIDLSTPPPPPTTLLDALPRRVTLTLAELRLVAERAGGAPLPFDVVEPRWRTRARRPARCEPLVGEDAAYADALASLHDPAATLERRGLLGDDANGEAARRGRPARHAHHRRRHRRDRGRHPRAVVAPAVTARPWRRSPRSTASSSSWPGSVRPSGPPSWAASAVLPDDLAVRASTVPAHVDVPFELADAATEAIHSGRTDLVPVLAAHHAGSVVDAVARRCPTGR